MRCFRCLASLVSGWLAHRRECRRMLEGRCDCHADNRWLCDQHAHASPRVGWLAAQMLTAQEQHLAWVASLEDA